MNKKFLPGAMLFTLTIIALTGFGVLAPKAFGVSPAPDGCYSNFTTAEGCGALNSLTTGAGNTGLGWRSLFFDSTGGFNTGVGAGALALNNADSNTAVGAAALLLNSAGTENVAVGTDALVFNDVGSDNSAVGAFALFNNTADGNTALGAFALQANTTGGTLGTTSVFPVGPDTAIGSHALESNTIASGNTAVGYQALRSMVAGADLGNGPTDLGISTAVGFQALANLNGPSGWANAAFGYRALFNLTNGQSNVAAGTLALPDLTAGNGNVAVGESAGLGLTSGTGNVYIGAFVGAGAPSEIDHTYIRNIYTTVASGRAVYIDADNKIGTLSSSRRFKHDIHPMDKSSETLFALKPVTFRYKKDADPSQALSFGLIAEEVAQVNPELITCDEEGKPQTVRYEAVNAMLLNEFLKEHRKVEKLEATVASLAATVKEQATLIQKVSAQVQLKGAPAIAVNP